MVTKKKNKPNLTSTLLKEGVKAPSFRLPDSLTGKDLTLEDFKGKNLVLYFYPKDMTSGCTQEAVDFQQSLSKFKKKNAVIVGVSKDSVSRHEKFSEKYKLKFHLLSDEKGRMLEKYKVWKEKSMYGRKFMGIERSTYVIGPDGKIKKAFPKVKVKNHIQEVLEYL